jgi:hypothetical protein
MTTLTETILRTYASEQSFERGREYYHSGAIYNAIRQGNTLLADCEGTETYHLRVELDESGIQSTSCTCLYELGGYCKHLVALLLTYIDKAGEFAERKSLSTLLANVDKATLVTLLTKLADRQPELYTWLETSLPLPVSPLHRPNPSPGRSVRFPNRLGANASKISCALAGATTTIMNHPTVHPTISTKSSILPPRFLLLAMPRAPSPSCSPCSMNLATPTKCSTILMATWAKASTTPGKSWPKPF